MRNIENLRKVRDKITFTPRQHDQDSWGVLKDKDIPKNALTTKYQEEEFIAVSCDTSACTAGWAVTHAGDFMLFRRGDIDEAGVAHAQNCRDTQGNIREIPDRARDLLGLTELQSEILFAPYWSTEETVQMIDVLMKEDVPNRQATRELQKLTVQFGYDEF